MTGVAATGPGSLALGAMQVRVRKDLAPFATPKEMASLSRHRWFYFPHSFAPGLVEAVLDHFQLPAGSRLLDPFVGAGTTLAVARSRGLNALGLDISPLSVLISQVKTRNYEPASLRAALRVVSRQAERVEVDTNDVSFRLKRAFMPSELAKIVALRHAISGQEEAVRDFLLLALLWSARTFSRAVADGGWFRWTDKPERAGDIIPAFAAQVQLMIADLELEHAGRQPRQPNVDVKLGDARTHAFSGTRFAAILTSPPYPNRHDYTRVFHIELLLMGKTEEEILDLRHRSMRSHVEASGRELPEIPFTLPDRLQTLLARWPAGADRRIPAMLSGYFEDLYRTLTHVGPLLDCGGRAAFVLGNVQHAGIPISVDEFFAEVARAAGMAHEETWLIRQRGNSAQQMGVFGRQPSRESVVVVRKSA